MTTLQGARSTMKVAMMPITLAVGLFALLFSFPSEVSAGACDRELDNLNMTIDMVNDPLNGGAQTRADIDEYQKYYDECLASNAGGPSNPEPYYDDPDLNTAATDVLNNPTPDWSGSGSGAYDSGSDYGSSSNVYTPPELDIDNFDDQLDEAIGSNKSNDEEQEAYLKNTGPTPPLVTCPPGTISTKKILWKKENGVDIYATSNYSKAFGKCKLFLGLDFRNVSGGTRTVSLKWCNYGGNKVTFPVLGPHTIKNGKNYPIEGNAVGGPKGKIECIWTIR